MLNQLTYRIFYCLLLLLPYCINAQSEWCNHKFTFPKTVGESITVAVEYKLKLFYKNEKIEIKKGENCINYGGKAEPSIQIFMKSTDEKRSELYIQFQGNPVEPLSDFWDSGMVNINSSTGILEVQTKLDNQDTNNPITIKYKVIESKSDPKKSETSNSRSNHSNRNADKKKSEPEGTLTIDDTLTVTKNIDKETNPQDATSEEGEKIIENEEEQEIKDPIVEDTLPFEWILLGGGALFAFVLIVFLLVNKRRGSGKKVTSVQGKKSQKSILPLSPSRVSDKVTGKSPTSSIILIGKADENKPGKNIAPTERELHFQYVSFPMYQLWNNSVITDIFLGKKCIIEIDQFLFDENLSRVAELNTKIPEIGGMLFGTYVEDSSNNTYKVYVEHFEPIESEGEDQFELVFKTKSLTDAILKVEKQYPSLGLVAWFHTHPGHGLFLSPSDLRIQNGFFKEPYQFAMEIDSLSSNVDTGFFTWQQYPRMINNVTGTHSWYSWKDIRNHR